MNVPSFAFLSEQQAHLGRDDGTADVIESQFAADVRRREASIERKTGWKTRGTGARFMGAAALWDESEGRRQPAFFTCLSRGRRAGEILYALTTGTVSGIFAYDVAKKEETRLRHDTDGPPFAIATSDDHCVVAISRGHKNGAVNIAVMRDDGTEAALVTDGDTIDAAPSWTPVGPDVKEGRHRLVYSSTAIGRDMAGTMAGFAPSEINLLDAEHGTLETIVRDPTFDYLAPRMMADGTLYAMRRPYRSGPPAPTPAAMLKDGVLAPMRLMYAGYRYLDFFTMRYTGKPLTTSGSTQGRRVDARRLLERQNVAGAGEDDDETASRAPDDWVLVRRSPGGEDREVARHVAAFDVAKNGSILVSDGVTLLRIDPSGVRTRVGNGKLVTTLVSL
jgi:hypothetical protein